MTVYLEPGLSPFVIQAATVFMAIFALDFVWARYTYAVTAKSVIKSSLYASGLIVLSGTAAIGYTHDPWLLIPAAMGAFFGTAIAVKTAAKG